MAQGSIPNPRGGVSWPKTPKSSKSQGAESPKRPSTGGPKGSTYKTGKK